MEGNAVLVQGATLADIEKMIGRAVDARLEAFCARIVPQHRAIVRRKDAARMLGVSLPTLDAYAKVGIVHPLRLGGRVFFDETELMSGVKHLALAEQ